MNGSIKKTASKALAIGLSGAMLCSTAAFAQSLGFVGEQMGSLTVSAAGTETPASSFTYQKNEYGEISITGFIGSETKVIIPSEIDGCPVTNITSYGAFSKRAGVISVVIPDGVTSIGDYAFYGCTGLTSITIPDSVKSIGWGAFEDCTGLTSLTIGNSVTSISERAFYGCTGLTSVTIPDNVTSIEGYAFYGCTGLTSITIGNSVTGIYCSAFENCTGLTSITIPDSVKSIGLGAFNGCTGLTSITIPDSVAIIGESAFENCTGLTSITIPDNVTSIEDYAFNGCTGLTSITIPDNVTSIEGYAFKGCAGLTSVTIGNSVAIIGESAFEDCTGLTSITIPDSVKSIGWGAFNGCTGLTSVTIPESVTDIGDYAFEFCDVLNIYGVSGSYAETYANENNIPFVALAPLTNTSTINSEKISLGSRITFNGDAKGGSGSYTYTYSYKRTSAKLWKTIGTEDTEATVVFFTPVALGDFDIKITAKDSKGNTAEKTFTVSVVDGKSTAFKNNSTINVTGAKPGTKIKLTGVAEGTGTYKYAFYYKRTTAKQWYIIGTEFSDTNMAQFTPKTEGEFNVKVDIIDENGEIVSRQFAVSISNDYAIETSMKNRSSIDTEIAPVDSRITITGAATRGTAPYKYAYYYKKAAAKNWKAIGEEFTDAKTASIKLRNEGDYIIKVCVKDSTGAMVSKNFDVTITAE